MRALGFSRMDSKAEAEFIQEGIKECIDEGLVLKNQKLNRGSMVVAAGESMGVYIYGRYEENRFVYEYHFPFLMGSVGTLNDEITIERHLDKESFAAVCDEAKTGVTLIFYLQNIMDYLDYLVKAAGNQKLPELLDTRGASVKNPVPGKRAVMTALSIGGMILLPIRKKQEKDKEAEESRRRRIAAAKRGDEQAMESLTLEDIDTYTEISHRIIHEDVFSIVDSTFMPCGVECDQYSVIGEILELSKERNSYTGENIYIMNLECNDVEFTLGINEKHLLGEPMVGRRFKGQIWLQGNVKFNK
jgi:hypothetical protein